MNRHDIIETIGSEYMTANIEAGEYSYIKEAGSKEKLERALRKTFEHYKLDIRFESDDVVVLVETKRSFVDSDANQLREYLEEEKALHIGKKIICILANTSDDKIRVWKSFVDDTHLLTDEYNLDNMQHYKDLFDLNKQNNREKVLRNTYDLNELLHKKDIDERLRSQFVGTTLLYIKKEVDITGMNKVDDDLIDVLNDRWKNLTSEQICTGIRTVLKELLDGSDNKTKKIELLQKNVLDDQKVKALSQKDWIQILDYIVSNIYKYIDADSSEGQDILNLFFIAFNKYTGKADKNQAFTPDHITDFMCRITDVDRTKRIFDGTCGSGSFLVQAMVKELADCKRDNTDREARELMDVVKKEHIYGVEIEEKAYGLATTNMLIHGDGNSNIKFASLFDCENFIREANPDIILMNPPYNAKPKGIPEKYKRNWGKAKDGKEEPTNGFVFIHFISDVIKKINKEREENDLPRKEVKLAVLLPVSAAIGTTNIIKSEKENMLRTNTLEAVFTLPGEIFYPGASACACCMLFTLGKPHVNQDRTVNKTYFGYYREDGFKKKKSLGRVEQFDSDGNSKWKSIENQWISLYRNKDIVDGLSSMMEVDSKSEWLCEAYMKTDYTKLKEEDFQKTLNNYLSYLVKEGNVYES